VHSIHTTDAAQADVSQLPDLIHGDEREIYGDRAYWKEAHRRSFREVNVRYGVNRRGHRSKPLNAYWKRLNQQRSRVRARVEHAFHVVKRLWGFKKVRYRGLAKNTTRVYAAFVLANLYLVRRKLLPHGGECPLEPGETARNR